MKRYYVELLMILSNLPIKKIWDAFFAITTIKSISKQSSFGNYNDILKDFKRVQTCV
jgi:hypothetical protein